MDAQLDERKVTILKAIIKTYLETGEPVGSRTISKYSELKLSSATIRNEMSDLEEMGYIIQPHTSAGRIPSDKGYRFYVDQIMQEKENEVTEFKDVMVQKVDKLELVLKKMAQALAANTNYAAMISGPSYHKTKLKFIQLSRVEANKLLVVVVVEGNIIKNTMIDIGEDLGEQELLNLNILLNSSLNGLTIEEINLGIISKLKEDAGIHSKVIELVLNEVAEAIKAGGEDLQIYTSGATNIFRYPELAEGEKASKLIGTLEQKEVLQEFVSDVNADQQGDGGIQVYIGDETPIQSMKDCSVVTANYDLGGGLRGTVGSAEEKTTEKAPEKEGFFKKKKDPKDEKIEELTDRVKRQMAEFDNFRKRTEKEKSTMYEMGAKDIIERMLPVVDNFERGLASIPESEKNTAFAEGMEKIYKQFQKVLEDAGVKAIEAAGQPFDPNFHNAVMHVEDESLGENIVAEELQKGYMYRDSVVRHSMVKVAN